MIYVLSSLLNNSSHRDKYITIQTSLNVKHALFNWFGQRSLNEAYACCPHLTSFNCFVLQFLKVNICKKTKE